jgi:hypothetical protein
MKARRSTVSEWFLRPPAPASVVVRIVVGVALSCLIAFGPQTWRAWALTNRFVSTLGDDMGGSHEQDRLSRPQVQRHGRVHRQEVLHYARKVGGSKGHRQMV